MVIRINSRRELPLDWSVINPILGNGELGVEKEDADTIKFKIGDGFNDWNSLPYCEVPSSTVDNSNLNAHINNLNAHNIGDIRQSLLELSQNHIVIIEDNIELLQSDINKIKFLIESLNLNSINDFINNFLKGISCGNA